MHQKYLLFPCLNSWYSTSEAVGVFGEQALSIASFRSSCSFTLTYSLTFLSPLALKVVKIPGETLKNVPSCSSCIPNNSINKAIGVNFE